MTTDGVTWQRLLDTGAIRGLPANCYFDRYSRPSSPSLYVGFGGRSIMKIGDLGGGGGVILHAVAPAADTETPPVPRRVTRIRIADGRLGVAEVAPDDRLFVTLDDGESLLVKAETVTVLEE
jgi:hypothetical protein